MILIISSFFIGGMVMYYISYFPFFRKDLTKNYYSNNNTKVYEKNTLKEAIDKVYNSVVLIENVDETSSNSTGTGFNFVPASALGGIEFNYHRVQYPDDYDDFYLRAPGPKDPFYNGTQWAVNSCSGEGPWNGYDNVPVPPATDKLSKFIRY